MRWNVLEQIGDGVLTSIRNIKLYVTVS